MRLIVFTLLALYAATVVAATPTTKEPPERYAFLYDPGRKFGEAEIRAGLPFGRIYLRKSGCRGTCPAYEVTLQLDGTAEYLGLRFAPREGEHAGTVSLDDFGRLCYAIEALQFSHLEGEYAAMRTDDETITVEVYDRDGNLHHRVSDYGGQAPIAFWLLVNSINAVAEDIAWTASN